ncbi:MAG: dTMP kinase [Clostridia bacterium]|nr:dTMP kinase [Clostridia bacterium]
MLRFKTIVFDLDGTLFDSAPGIIHSWHYAFGQIGENPPSDEDLKKFIGPAIDESLEKYSSLTEEQMQRIIPIYRNYYYEEGYRKTLLYPRVRTLLRTLHEQGARILVATGKPERAGRRILEYFHLMSFIDGISGVGPVDAGVDKPMLISRVLKDADPSTAVMIGDYPSDVSAAKDLGMTGIGVTYGFGDQEQLIASGCMLAHSVDELFPLLTDTVPAKKGFFLSVEGLDGCGKTTQSDALERSLREFGFTVRRTREPGGCPISEKIRDLLLDIRNEEMYDITEALLYAASRAQHVHQVIRPAIEDGQIVLCDRFVDSSVAFQGGGRQLGVELIQQINAPAINGYMPSATVYLRLDHETALRRRANASALDRIEKEKAEFHARVEAAYEQLAEQDAGRFIIVDATKNREAIAEEILTRVLERIDALEVG